MPFGHKTLVLVSLTDGPTPGELGTYPQVESLIPLPGCRHRPLTFQETAELQFDVATKLWKSTVPIGEYSPQLRASAVGVLPDALIRVDGIEYSVIAGVQPFDDFDGPFKATIYSKLHIG